MSASRNHHRQKEKTKQTFITAFHLLYNNILQAVFAKSIFCHYYIIDMMLLLHTGNSPLGFPIFYTCKLTFGNHFNKSNIID